MAEAIWVSDEYEVRVCAPTGNGPRGHQYRVYYPRTDGTRGKRSVRRDTREQAVETAQQICTLLRERDGRSGVILRHDEPATAVIDFWQKPEGHAETVSLEYLVAKMASINKWVVPVWQGLTCADLEAAWPWEQVLTNARSHLKTSSMNALRQLLNGLRTAAHRGGFIDRAVDPLADIPKERGGSTERFGYVPELARPREAAVWEVAREVERRYGQRMAAAIYLAGWGGLRRGEVLAVRPRDIDGTVVRVEQQVQVMRDPETRKPVGPCAVLPKYGKVRTTAMPRKIADLVAEACQGVPFDEPIVSINALPEPARSRLVTKRRNKQRSLLLMDPMPFVNSWIRPVFEDVAAWDDSRWTFHALRHHYANGLLQRGVPLHQISWLLGHASVLTTERTYVSRGDGATGAVVDAWA